MTRVNMELITDHVLDKAKINSKWNVDGWFRWWKSVASVTSLPVYRQAYITAGVELLKNELILLSNKKEELKNSTILQVKSCKNRIREVEAEIAAILKESGNFFFIFKEISPGNPTSPSEIIIDDDAMAIDQLMMVGHKSKTEKID